MLNWQIGKKYRRRNGIISTMTRDFASSVLPKRVIDFGDGNPVWAENAQRSNEYIGEYGIIEEVKENEMKIEVGKYYKNERGQKVKIIEILSKESAAPSPVIGCVFTNDIYACTMNYQMDGTNWENSKYDLIEEWKEPKSGVAYINVYPECVDASAYKDRAETNKHKDNDRIACVRVEWKEGQFDD